jgi:hypothetical protein
VPDYLRETGFSFKVASRIIDLPEIQWSEISEDVDFELPSNADDAGVGERNNENICECPKCGFQWEK